MDKETREEILALENSGITRSTKFGEINENWENCVRANKIISGRSALKNMDDVLNSESWKKAVNKILNKKGV